MRTFGDGSQKVSQSDNEMDLEIKKNFYYVISPDGEIVDCAKIYTFLHEDNIFKRIIARVSQHVDTKINKSNV